jgi:hypothetical protein
MEETEEAMTEKLINQLAFRGIRSNANIDDALIHAALMKKLDTLPDMITWMMDELQDDYGNYTKAAKATLQDVLQEKAAPHADTWSDEEVAQGYGEHDIIPKDLLRFLSGFISLLGKETP